MICYSRSAKETQKIAEKFARELKRGSLVALIGDLGAGKTTFIQGMARGLGVSSNYTVNSPTFTLVNEYPPLIHIDLYRIEKPKEMETLGLEDYLTPENVVVIEWADKLEERYDFKVILKRGEKEGDRQIEII